MNLLQMRISGAVLILGVVLIRLAALRAVPKRTFLILWALVLVRLLVPFPPLLPLPSLLPEGLMRPVTATAAPTVPGETVQREQLPQPRQTAAPASGASAVTAPPAPAMTSAPAVTAMPRETVAGETPASKPGSALSPRMASVGRAALIIWLLGMCTTAAVFAVLYGRSYRRFRRANPVETPAAAAWLQTHPMKRKLSLRGLAGLDSPLTYGILRPVILLPESLDPASEEAAYALEHEYIHARRLDALWKLLLAVTLAVHWFNPLVWLMWFLANRDLELSCDEEVLRRFGTEQRGDYARALLAMEEKRALLPPLHSGFGAGTTKERILAIMKYKKATVLSVALAAVLVAVLAACALGGAERPKETPEPTPTPIPSAAPTDTPTPAPSPTSLPDEFARFESGGYTLSIPAEYTEALTVETERMTDYWEVLFTVTEKASYEAGQKLSPGNEDGLGWLFSIARIGEDELGKLMMWDMSGMVAFAREQSGDYLLLIQPTDVRFVPNGEDDETRMAQWEAMQDWTWASMTERFLEDNASLTPCRHGDSFVENALARVLYYDPAEYGEADQALIRYGDGEGVDPLGTSQAWEDAHKLLWGYRFDGAAAADFPKKGATVTVTNQLGIELTFREGSDVVAVANVSTDVRYLRMVPDTAELKGHNIGSWACGWYFHAAATLSGETASYRNGDFTLRLPAEYASRLLVETPEDGETLFNVYEKDSWRRWAAGSDRAGDEKDGWLFSILREERESWARSVTGGSSGEYVFAEDSEGYCYVCSYPIWQTFQPEEGTTADPESEAYRQFRTVTTVLRAFDFEQYFIADNSLTARYFTDVQQYFLCFAIYGYEDCNIRQGREEDAFDPRRSETALWYLKQLLWDMDYSEVESAQEPEGEPVVLDIGFGRLLFWEDSSLVLLESGESARYFMGSHRGIVYGAYPIGHSAAQCLEAARIAAALPRTSGKTTNYSNQGMSLAIPAEYGDVLHIETPESEESLFRVSHRYSWESGQKLYPGEDWGAGFLFGVIRLDEDQLLRDLLVYPPQTMAGRDREGNYYLIVEPLDMSFVTEDGSHEYASDPHWREYMALVQWTGQAAELFRSSNPDTLIPMEKAFCELEIILAEILYRESAEKTDIRLVTPEFFRFVSPEGAVTEGADVPDKFDYARRILLEGSSCYLPADTPAPEGRPIRLEISVSGGSSRLLYTFWPGSELVMEDTFYDANGVHSSRMLRMTLPKDGPNIGYLMARWYGKAAEDVVHHLTAEVVGYGNDTICIKVTDPGDSRLPIGFEMYIGGSYLSENGEYAPAFELPLGCIVEVEYSGEVVADEFGYCGPTGGPAGYIRVVEP